MTQLDYTFDRQLELERDDARCEGFEEGRAAGLEKGREEGREQGREEGREEAISQLIRAMLKNGKSQEEIAAFTGIDIEEIHKMIN